jgi:hypothetical protein
MLPVPILPPFPPPMLPPPMPPPLAKAMLLKDSAAIAVITNRILLLFIPVFLPGKFLLLEAVFH